MLLAVLFIPLILVVFAAILVFEILMFINAIQNKRITTNVKMLWIIGMLLFHPFVAIAYYFVEYKKIN